MSSPHDTEHDTPHGARDTTQGPVGPRVTREEVRDLSRLRRSRNDRKVAGVAGGIARHLDIDPLLVRVAFVVLTFVGGGGLILYGVAWVLLPEEDTGEAVIRTDDGVRAVALIIAGVIAAASVVGDSVGGMDFPWPLMLVGLVLLVVFGSKQARENRASGASGTTPPPAPPTGVREGHGAYEAYEPWIPPGPPAPPARPTDPRRRGPLLFPFSLALAALGLGVVGTLDLAGVDVAPSAYPATVLGVAGVMLLVGAFYGRAGGLILVGLLAAGATAITSAVDDVRIGQTVRTPTTAAALADGYDLGVGEVVIDLTELDDAELADLAGRRLTLDVGIGHIRVIVPDDGLRVVAEADVEAGEVVLFGKRTDHSARGDHGEPGDPTLTIDAELFLGQIEVLTEEEAA